MSEDSVLAALTRLEAGQGLLRADLARLETGQGSLRADLAQLETGQGSLRADLARLETGHKSLHADLARLETGQNSLRADFSRLEAGQVSLRVDVMDRIDRLQNTVEGMRDDIRVNFGASDRVGRIASGASEEVRALGAEVSAMERQIMRLRADVDELKKSA